MVIYSYIQLHMHHLFCTKKNACMALFYNSCCLCMVCIIFCSQQSWSLAPLCHTLCWSPSLSIHQMILSFELPFALVPLLKFTSSKTKMGTHVNSTMVNFFGNMKLIVLHCNQIVNWLHVWQKSVERCC